MRIVDFTESMLGMPSPPCVRPLEPSGAIVKCVRGASVVSARAGAAVIARASAAVVAARTDVRVGM